MILVLLLLIAEKCNNFWLVTIMLAQTFPKHFENSKV